MGLVGVQYREVAVAMVARHIDFHGVGELGSHHPGAPAAPYVADALADAIERCSP